jgi:hypothetical protein
MCTLSFLGCQFFLKPLFSNLEHILLQLYYIFLFGVHACDIEKRPMAYSSTLMSLDNRILTFKSDYNLA